MHFISQDWRVLQLTALKYQQIKCISHQFLPIVCVSLSLTIHIDSYIKIENDDPLLNTVIAVH